MAKKRIAVIGGERLFNIKSQICDVEWFDWQKALHFGNVTDYDSILVNLVQLPEQGSEQLSKLLYDGSLSIHRWVEFFLKAHGKLILYGNPGKSVRLPSPIAIPGAGRQIQRKEFSSLLPLAIKWDRQGGKTVRLGKDSKDGLPNLERYVKNWESALRSANVLPNHISFKGERDANGQWEYFWLPKVFLVSGGNDAVAFSLTLIEFIGGSYAPQQDFWEARCLPNNGP